MNYLPLLKSSPILVVGSAISFHLLADTGASSSASVLPQKFDSLEVVVYVKGSTSSSSPSPNPINLKIAIPHDIYSGSIKAEYKKEEGKDEYERVDYIGEQNKKEKYNNLAKLAHQFLKVQHRLNLVKSARWKNERNTFDETCKKCCSQAQSNTCSLCICCKKDCTPGSTDCCCKDPNSNCKWELKKETMDTFFLHLKNLDTANTGKYLSPVKAYITVNTTDDTKVEEGSFWGSLVYGFTTYKLWKGDVPDGEQLKRILGSSTTISTDKYYANVPQKFSFKFKKDDASDEKKIGKILEKLSKKDEIVKLMNDTTKAPENLCACCDDSTDMIECLIKRNYWVGMAEEGGIKTNIDDKIKDLKEKCCETP